MTVEVKEGDVDAGEFFYTLTEESFGTSVEFIIADAQRGRAASLKDGRYFVAIGQDIIPESWEDLVGPEFVGTPFAEYPDAEEVYKDRVNSGEIEWGKGPQVSTTYNYTGLVVVPAEEGSDEEDQLMPVRISFLRSTKSAHDKIQNLRRSLLRGKPYWDLTFQLSTKEKTFGRNTSFIVIPRKGRPTTADEKAAASELALAARSGRVESNDEKSQDKRVEPEAKGGVDL